MGSGGRGGVTGLSLPLPEDQLQFGRLCSSLCHLQWPLTSLQWVFALRRCRAPRPKRLGHFTPSYRLSTQPSSKTFSPPAFWMVPPHFGPKAPPPSCISWPAGRVAPPLRLCGRAAALENHFCRGWVQRVGCSRWSCCLRREEIPLLEWRGRWTEWTQVWLNVLEATERLPLGGLNCELRYLSKKDKCWVIGDN